MVRSIVRSPQYQARSLALFITFDGSDGSATNLVSTYVVVPSVPPGLRVGIAFARHSLLCTIETLPSLAPLANATRVSQRLDPSSTLHASLDGLECRDDFQFEMGAKRAVKWRRVRGASTIR